MVKLLIHETRRLNKNEIIDAKLWEVPVTKDNPDGVTYSLNYRIFNKKIGDWESIIRYDNAHKYKNHKTNHHRHIGNEVTEIKFENLDKLYSELLVLRIKLKKERKIHKIDEVDKWEDLK